MIQYVLCQNGAFEYDKLILNALQHHNMVAAMESKVAEELASEMKRLREAEEELAGLARQVTAEAAERVYAGLLLTE